MRIDSGLQGYYYDQGRFRYSNAETDESAPIAQASAVSRAGAPQVESSTLLSFTLSSALWAMDAKGVAEADVAGEPAAPLAPASGNTDTAEAIEARYLEYTTDY